MLIETDTLLKMSNHMLYLIVLTYTLWSLVKYICSLDSIVAYTCTSIDLVTSTQFVLTTDTYVRLIQGRIGLLHEYLLHHV